MNAWMDCDKIEKRTLPRTYVDRRHILTLAVANNLGLSMRHIWAARCDIGMLIVEPDLTSMFACQRYR